jgi:hypothetical protein
MYISNFTLATVLGSRNTIAVLSWGEERRNRVLRMWQVERRGMGRVARRQRKCLSLGG